MQTAAGGPIRNCMEDSIWREVHNGISDILPSGGERGMALPDDWSALFAGAKRK